MAVGKGSMERASKAAKPADKNTVSKAVKPADKNATSKAAKPAPAKAAKSVAKKATAPKTVAAKKKIEGHVEYQKCSQMLERAAEPNEKFYIGDAMPIYYF